MPADCDAVDELAKNDGYKCLVFFKGIVAIVSIVLFALHAGRRRKQRLYHINTRIIYWCFCLLTFWSSVHYVPLHFYDFLRLSLPLDACDRLYPMKMVFYLRLTTTSVMFILDFVLLVLCLERVICTLKISDYEESSCPKVVTSLLLIATSFWGMVYYLFMSPGVDFNSANVQTNARTKENAASGPIIIFMLITCESASVVLFLYIRQWNLRLGRHLHTNPAGGGLSQKFLSTKFQIGETLRVTEVFLPILIIKWTLTVFGAAAIYCLRVIPAIIAASPSTQATLFEAVNVNYLHGLTTPMFLMYRCDQLGSFLLGSKVKPVEDVIATHGRNDFEDYFKRLENVFNA